MTPTIRDMTVQQRSQTPTDNNRSRALLINEAAEDMIVFSRFCIFEPLLCHAVSQSPREFLDYMKYARLTNRFS